MGGNFSEAPPGVWEMGVAALLGHLRDGMATTVEVRVAENNSATGTFQHVVMHVFYSTCDVFFLLVYLVLQLHLVQ